MNAVDILINVGIGIASIAGAAFLLKISAWTYSKFKTFQAKRWVREVSTKNQLIRTSIKYNEVIEFCLKEELAEPRVEVHRVFTKFWYAPSIVDDKPILKKVICLLSTGIIIVEKTTDIEYYFAFTEFLKENIKNTNESILYSLVISLNNCLRRLKPLTDQSLRILLIELWKRVFGGEDKVGKGFLYIA